MEKAMYPSPYIRITQKDHVGTHADSWAVDEAGSDSGIDYMKAPFTGVIKKIYTSDANEVWLESKDKVEYPDGTIDYMTIMLCHDNDVSNLYVGKVIKQGERFYEEGTKGNASGNHCHIECAKGKFTGTGWHKNSAGYWSINNGKKISDCLFIDDSYHLLDTKGYTFKNVKSVAATKPSAESQKNYVNLPGNIDTWNFYDLNVSPVKKNAKGQLKPSKFGGLSYYVYEYKDNGNTAVINTVQFGKVKIYIKGTPATITIGSYQYKQGNH